MGIKNRERSQWLGGWVRGLCYYNFQAGKTIIKREKEGHFVCVCLQVRMSVEEIERSHLQIFIKDTISVLKKFGLRLEQTWMLCIGNEMSPTLRDMEIWTTCPKVRFCLV